MDRSAKVASVGGLVLAADNASFYVWEQYGWSAGYAGSSVRRFSSTSFNLLDQTTVGYQQNFLRNPLDAPVLLDTVRELIVPAPEVGSLHAIASTSSTLTTSSRARSTAPQIRCSSTAMDCCGSC
jgi:hypothetical protein